MENGTQCSDIAPKIDQDLGTTPAKPKEKKKYYDILLSDLNESYGDNIINRGFLKNTDGHYQRGNYILMRENDKYIVIHKNKIKEDLK